MPVLEQNRPSDLHFDILIDAPAVTWRNTPMTTEMQANVKQDVKDLAAKYFQLLKVEQFDPDVWATITLEIVSEETSRYILQLESLLQEAANDTTDEAFAAKITAVLK
jgi:hypothetical protein